MPGPYEPNFRKGVFSTLALVADHAQEGAPVIGILGGLDPLGRKPSMTPITPRPSSVSAMMTSTGLAVAQ